MRNAGKIATVVAAALSLAACVNSQVASDYPAGGGPSYPAPNPVGASSAPSSAPSSSPASGQAGAPARVCTADDVVVTGDPGTKPTITIPDTCTAPATLLTKDLTPGTGPAVAAGTAVQVNYELVSWSDKTEQDSSYGSQPLALTIGQGEVIEGWDQGLIGIRQGGRRLLIIPPELGYGAQGNQTIKPNETLVFVVDAVQVSG